jgi:hypothetical protein
MRVRLLGGLLVLILPTIAAASSVDLAAFKDKPICEKVAKLFGDRLVPDAELLKTVEWKPVELKGQGPKGRYCSSLDKALVDLDNDGQQDLVVKTTFCMKGAPSDSLYMFPAESPVLEHAGWQDMSPLLATSDKFERTGGAYPLTSLRTESVTTPPSLTTVFAIQPFRLDGVTYVGLTDARREWMVIAKYLRGERFEDQCYLKAAAKF